jgi:pseudaminic acid biosynthesis-associated methylase
MMETKQEAFWTGQSGDAYTKKNTDNDIGSQIHFFSEILARARGIRSIYEIGANVGLNLDAIKRLSAKIDISGCEINEGATATAVSRGHKVEHSSIFDLQIDRQFDLVFTRGVLVHINPDRLNDFYDRMGRLASKYILIDEYFAPTPTPIHYMNQDDVLFKRDFGREIMNRLDLVLLAYGFRAKIDPEFPGYDTNWYLFQKK